MEVGKYGEAVTSNQKAVAADLIYCGLRGHFTYYHGYLVTLCLKKHRGVLFLKDRMALTFESCALQKHTVHANFMFMVNYEIG